MSQMFFEKWKTKSNGYNFFKYSLIFAFSTILAENKYILTYLIRISIKIAQNKYTYWKKVSRRNPVLQINILQFSVVQRTNGELQAIKCSDVIIN